MSTPFPTLTAEFLADVRAYLPDHTIADDEVIHCQYGYDNGIPASKVAHLIGLIRSRKAGERRSTH